MSKNVTSITITDPYVFSRGSLKFTFDLLRKKDPQLALCVQNIINGVPLPKSTLLLEGKNSDSFKVDLDSFQVRAVVEILMQQTQADLSENGNAGMLVVAKALLDDWVVLAKKMVSELPDDQKPQL